MLAFVCTVFTERCSASAEAQDETRRSWLSEVVLSVLVAVGVVLGLALVIAASLLIVGLSGVLRSVFWP